jgi:predicted AlkP superfamily phosphohydrolase/phosphomutase/tetratricopeptide (TPR) repeat protein
MHEPDPKFVRSLHSSPLISRESLVSDNGKNAPKVLLIGWDAADWKMIHPLLDNGLMPHTQSLVEGGVMANLATLSPVLSPMLWTSIATGKRPFKHGILGFSEPTVDGKGVQPVTNLSRRTKAVWNILNQNGKRCHVVGWWPSHPAEPINGVMVSNHYQRAPKPTDLKWPMADGTVHPTAMAEELAELRFHPLELEPEHLLPFVPHGDKVDQDKDRRLHMLMQVIADCTSIQSCATHLLQHEPWDFAAVYFDAIDHFGHGFMKYHPPKQPFVSQEDFDIYQNVVAAGYVYHDMMLGRLLELAGKDTTVILMSDHGFHPDHLRPNAIPVEPAGPAIEHRDLGIFVMRGPGIKADQRVHSANLLDIAPTILTLFDLPVGADMDGRPLVDAFVDPPAPESIPSWDEVKGDDGGHPPGKKLDADESRQSLEQLVALGYIERPSDNHEEAVARTQRELDYNLAMSYMDAGMHGSAAPLLAKLYQAYPLEFRFGIQLAMCLQALGMTRDLETLIGHLSSRWRQAAERAKLRLSEIAETGRERRQQWRQAKEALPEGDVPDSPPELFNEQERHAIRNLRAIARGNAQSLDYLASNVAIAKKDFETALDHLHRIDAAEADNAGFQLRLGNAYLELRQNEAAETCFLRAQELDPENPDAHTALCRSYLQRRQNQQALDQATAAIGLKYHFPPAHYFLGIARHRLDDIEGAVEALERAIAQNPNFAEAHTRLALIYDKRLGDPKRAEAHRSQGADIRHERRRMRRRKILPDLPELDNAAIDANLPDLPDLPQSNLLPPLAAAPVAGVSSESGPFATVVSGLPRSGTSMMMQMLVAGGLPPLSDRARQADENNPRGYFELEKVKRLSDDNTWLDEARGKAVKIVAPLLPMLPQACSYRVVFLRRDLDEILASQNRMLQRLERQGGDLDEQQLRQALERQILQADRVLKIHQIPVLRVDYAEVLADPLQTARHLAEFIGLDLDLDAMRQAVVGDLYRERARRD